MLNRSEPWIRSGKTVLSSRGLILPVRKIP